jgi:hypothetical protein
LAPTLATSSGSRPFHRPSFASLLRSSFSSLLTSSCFLLTSSCFLLTSFSASWLLWLPSLSRSLLTLLALFPGTAGGLSNLLVLATTSTAAHLHASEPALAVSADVAAWTPRAFP